MRVGKKNRIARLVPPQNGKAGDKPPPYNVGHVHVPKAAHAASLAGWGAWVSALSPRGRVELLGPDDVEARIRALPGAREIGKSREGRPIFGASVGSGPLQISVMAGAHPDEPVGTLTALHLLETFTRDPRFKPLLERVTFHVVPQANPDGAARNEPWFSKWPDLASYFKHVARDLPKDDVEFGFPEQTGGAARPENRAIARFFDDIGRIDHHVSLHSMFLGGGALFLVTAPDLDAHRGTLRFLLAEADAVGLPLHDKDRKGQKGFFRIGPGLQTAPTAEAMRAFFAGQKTADAFLLNSMQYVAKNASCPFSLVSEIPLVYDPRISSQEPASVSRKQVEQELAEGFLAVADRVAPFAAGLPEIEARLASLRSAAQAQLADLARWGDEEANVGVVVENQLNLLRREATLLAAVAARRPGGDAEDRLSELVDEIERTFQLRYPAIDVQMRMQIASVLAGALGEAAPAPPPASSRR